MNAPYDGDREQSSDGRRPPEDPYARDAYTRDPFRDQDPAPADPLLDPVHEGSAQAPPPGGVLDPRGSAGAGGSGLRVADLPSDAVRGDDVPGHGAAAGPLVAGGEAPGKAASAPAHGDAFAHLLGDQGHRPETPGGTAPPSRPSHAGPTRPTTQAPEAGGPPRPPVPGAPAANGDGPRPPRTGKAAGLLRSSAIMAAGTMVSRLTGFVRSALIVVALGAVVLGDTYQLAITLPTMLYILTVGGGLNSVFVPQLVRAMKHDEDGGQAYANRLLTLVSVILGLLSVLAFFAAPLLVRMMSVKIAEDPSANEVAVTFVRFCLPSIFFMGIHVVMGQILNARERFGAMMWTPVLNNIVIIFTVGCFLWVYGAAGDSGMSVENIPPEGVRLLGAGTLLGLVVQAGAMVPYLRAAGFRIRPRFDWRGHGLGKAARLAKWTILFVLANQAGVLVVSQLSTWAGAVAGEDGHAGTNFIAYSNAQLIWNMPQAIITVSVMAALLPRLSRSASDGDTGAVRDDISQGLRNSAVAIVPISFGFLALGVPMCTLIYGSSGVDSARSMGYMLMAFGLGLIPFSVQYIVLRGFYAYEDTRTPFYNTVIVAAVNAAASALCFVLLPARWAVVGMAASYGLAYVIGVGVAWRRLRRRLGGDLDGAHVVRTYARLAGASVPAALAAGGAAYGIAQTLGNGFAGSVTALVAGGLVLVLVFVLAAKRMRIAEMNALIGMVRGRLGR